MPLKKILIIRFSSIGDLVLTTPVIRCAKQQLPGTEIHVVTKEAFRPVLDHNPYVDKLHTFRNDISEVTDALAAEKYDVVIDLHRNLRSLRLKWQLKTKSFAFNKINLRKFLAVNFKMLGMLPSTHIVDRYFEAIAPLGVKNDLRGLDYFIAPGDEVNMQALFPGAGARSYAVLVVGGSYYTKKIPLVKLSEICSLIKLPVILLGGKEDKGIADELQKRFPGVLNGCGAYSLSQSASIIRQAEWMISSDTGLMHIASAFRKKIISVWGNTIPEFGMSPYLPEPESVILEVRGLSCRPCSKLGYGKCPLGHFKCMKEVDVSIVEYLEG